MNPWVGVGGVVGSDSSSLMKIVRRESVIWPTGMSEGVMTELKIPIDQLGSCAVGMRKPVLHTLTGQHNDNDNDNDNDTPRSPTSVE